MLDADAIKEFASLARDAGKMVKTEDGKEFLLVPEGYRAEPITPLNRPLPDYIEQQVQMDDAASFVAYLNSFKTTDTRLFVSVSGAKMVGDIDYHVAVEGRPQHRGHRVTWAMPASEEWKRWTAIDGKPLLQQAFAEFVEENVEDVVEPAGAALLDVATSLQAKKKVEFKSGVRLQNGDVQLVYDETTEAGGRGQLSVPTEIAIGIPVFFGGERYRIRAFLRWRIGDEGKLFFTIVLHRRQMILQDAVQTAAQYVAERTGLGALFGMPG